MPIKLPAKKAPKAKAKKAKKPMAPAAKAALLARLAKGRKDALGVSGKPATVSKVNKPGTAKAKRQTKAKSPRRVTTKAAPAAPRSSAFDQNFFR